MSDHCWQAEQELQRQRHSTVPPPATATPAPVAADSAHAHEDVQLTSSACKVVQLHRLSSMYLSPSLSPPPPVLVQTRPHELVFIVF